MRSDWILDVLADLKSFAHANDMPALAEQLDDTALVAMGEIAVQEQRKAKLHDGESPQTGTYFGGTRAG